MKLESNELHPHGLTDDEFDELFTVDRPVIFNFHGYHKFIHELTITRHNKNITVHGYKEEGTITTAFDMRVQNEIDRFHLLIDIIDKLELKEDKLKKMLEDKIKHHKEYIAEYGVDMPEIENWRWQNTK